MGFASSVGIVTRYGLGGPGIEFRWGTRLPAPVEIRPEAQPATYTTDTRVPFRGSKAAGAWR
jgi:hypothetical protein